MGKIVTLSDDSQRTGWDGQHVNLTGVTLTCTGCRETKPEAAFSPRKAARSGRQSRCRTCRTAWMRQQRGVESTSAHLDAPNNCEVCGAEGRIFLDHDHATGKHRGWLCIGCNRAIGLVMDDPARLRRLADYLDR